MPIAQDSVESLLAQHRQFLVQATALVAEDVADEKKASYKNFLDVLLQRLRAHQAWLLNRPDNGGGENAGPAKWRPITTTHEPDKNVEGLIVVRIDGPADSDTQTITLDSEESAAKAKADINQYNKLTTALARATGQQLALLRLLQRKRESHTNSGNDHTEIALLKQYNDLRDVAQQLIGIIADNRGVPVRSLYADGAFGVGSDD